MLRERRKLSSLAIADASLVALVRYDGGRHINKTDACLGLSNVCLQCAAASSAKFGPLRFQSLLLSLHV